VLDEIETLRAKLNEMVAIDDAILYSGEILKLSQKLDKLIFLKQAILIRKAQPNYIKQLQGFLCPTLYAKVVTC
jgi:hypothetical protein